MYSTNRCCATFPAILPFLHRVFEAIYEYILVTFSTETDFLTRQWRKQNANIGNHLNSCRNIIIISSSSSSNLTRRGVASGRPSVPSRLYSSSLNTSASSTWRDRGAVSWRSRSDSPTPRSRFGSRTDAPKTNASRKRTLIGTSGTFGSAVVVVVHVIVTKQSRSLTLIAHSQRT